MKKDTLITLGIVAVVGIIFLDKLKGLFGGAKTDQNNKQIEQYEAASPINNPFDPRYIQAIQAANVGKTMHYLTGATAKALAQKIYNSVSFWNLRDSTEDIQSAFATVAYRTQVAQIATIFQQLYKKDLLTFLKYDTDKWGATSGDKHAAIISTILNKVKNLPAY
jgi:hypothetical protein